jgi:hypothetical protein
MHWYHWHPSTRSRQARAEQVGSMAMLGLESMDDLSLIESGIRV